MTVPGNAVNVPNPPLHSVVAPPQLTTGGASIVDVRQATLSLGSSATVSASVGEPRPRVEKLSRAIYETLPISLSTEAQESLAKLLRVLPQLTVSGYDDLIPQAEIAAKAILANPPSLTLADAIQTELSDRVGSRPGVFRSLFRGGSPPTRVLLGMGTLLYFLVPLLAFAIPRLSNVPPVILGVSTPLLELVAFAGGLGSIVSIMVRMKDFAPLRDADQAVLFFTGFFKPLVGTAFALFVFAILNSGLLPVSIDASKSLYFFGALAFVSGFSERFASDVASRAEKTILVVKDVA